MPQVHNTPHTSCHLGHSDVDELLGLSPNTEICKLRNGEPSVLDSTEIVTGATTSQDCMNRVQVEWPLADGMGWQEGGTCTAFFGVTEVDATGCICSSSSIIPCCS